MTPSSSFKDIPRVSDMSVIPGQRILVRSGLNVPIENGVVRDGFRVRHALRTIQLLKERGARVIILAHIGREAEDSLEPVAKYMQQFCPVQFVSSVVDEQARMAAEKLSEGEVLMLENVRRHPEEQANDENFSKLLASLADVFVNDAFSASHREHASIVGVPQHLPSFAGIRFMEEIEQLSRAFTPQTPSVLVLGGAKFETKEPLVRKFLDVYDTVFVGGALAHGFFEAKGWSIGKSLEPDRSVDLSDLLEHRKLLLPRDVIVQNGGKDAVKKPNDVGASDIIYDAGPETVKELCALVAHAKFVLWNGPLGNYEKGFSESTETLARAVAGSSAHSIVGGGDTVASISQLNLEDKFSFVSTGGGAMLQFLTDGTLPGIDALRASEKAN